MKEKQNPSGIWCFRVELKQQEKLLLSSVCSFNSIPYPFSYPSSFILTLDAVTFPPLVVLPKPRQYSLKQSNFFVEVIIWPPLGRGRGNSYIFCKAGSALPGYEGVLKTCWLWVGWHSSRTGLSDSKQKSFDWALFQDVTKWAWHSHRGWGDGVFVPPTLDSVRDLMELLWGNPIPTTANVPSLGILIPTQECRFLSLVLWISSKLGV